MSGYSVKMKSTGRLAGKRPMFCPNEACKKMTSNLDDDCIQEFGVCKTCFIEFIEDRKVPLIDTNLFVARLRERGY